MQSFIDVISAWPSNKMLAEDLEVPAQHPNVWKARSMIPPRHWADLVAAAERRGIEGVTLELLAQLEKARSVEMQAARETAEAAA